MAKTAKQKGYKLQFKPTPISRLRHWKSPPKMVGDPPHDGTWASRERVVYEFEMDKKQIDPRGWSNQLYYEALANNEIIDYLVVRRWKDYAPAHDDNWLWDYDAAERDNSTWEYENNLVGA